MDKIRHMEFTKFVEMTLLYKLKMHVRFLESVKKALRVVDAQNAGVFDIKDFEAFFDVFDDKNNFERDEIVQKFTAHNKEQINCADLILVLSSSYLKNEAADMALIEIINQEADRKKDQEVRKSRRF